jgi:hypothetical protein
MCLDDGGGVLNVEYLRETQRGLPIQIEKAYAMVPAQRFLVVRYTLTNNIPPQDNKKVRARFTEVVDLHNKAAPGRQKSADALVDTGLDEPSPGQPRNQMKAQWHPELNAWIADMSASNGTFLVFGALQDMDRHRAFQPAADDVEFDRAVAPEMDTVDQPGPPNNVEQMASPDLGLSLWKEVLLGPAAKGQYTSSTQWPRAPMMRYRLRWQRAQLRRPNSGSVRLKRVPELVTTGPANQAPDSW